MIHSDTPDVDKMLREMYEVDCAYPTDWDNTTQINQAKQQLNARSSTPNRGSGLGDLTSTNKGTAARYNSGKTRVDLLPLYMVVDTLNCDGFNAVQVDAFKCLRSIADFQRSGDEIHLDNALRQLQSYWIECADVFAYGAIKYASWNWVKGMSWSVIIGCVGRHAFSVFRGEMNDKESTLPHIGHIMCNVVMLKAYFSGFPEGNDLPPKNFTITKE